MVEGQEDVWWRRRLSPCRGGQRPLFAHSDGDTRTHGFGGLMVLESLSSFALIFSSRCCAHMLCLLEQVLSNMRFSF